VARSTSAVVSHRFDIDEAAKAYDLLASGEPSLGILIRYPSGQGDEVPERLAARIVRLRDRRPAAQPTRAAPAEPALAVIGAGNYAGRVLIPGLRKAGATVRTVVSGSGVTAVHHGQRAEAEFAATDAQAAIDDPAVNAVVVATRHDSHARYVLAALRARRHVFVEKPLCLTLDELAAIQSQLAASSGLCLMVGFNRRFAPQVRKVKDLPRRRGRAKSFVMTVNAGAIPPDHWTQDREVGGGPHRRRGLPFHRPAAPPGRRTDRAAFGVGARSASVAGRPATRPRHARVRRRLGRHRPLPGERPQGFPEGAARSLLPGPRAATRQLPQFARLGLAGFSKMNLWRQDKGGAQCLEAFVGAIRDGGLGPIPLEETLEVSRISIALEASLA